MPNELTSFWEQISQRPDGPMAMRLVLQPIVSSLLAVRAGRRDARAGRPAFLKTILLDRALRGETIRSGWADVAKLFTMAFALDLVYQFIVYRSLHPLQALVVAAILALAVVAAAGPARGDAHPVALLVFLFLCTASHGILDAFTNGGRGVAFLAPFSGARGFAPWRPIEVSPLSLDAFLGSRGAAVLRSEAVWVWLPCAAVFLVGALTCGRPARARAARSRSSTARRFGPSTNATARACSRRERRRCRMRMWPRDATRARNARSVC